MKNIDIKNINFQQQLRFIELIIEKTELIFVKKTNF